VLVGAHYDTVPATPGADDNASGVAAGISLAQAFAQSKPARTLRFVFFTNEEPPHFQTENMGSFVYARDCRKRGDAIVAMLSLDSIGYYSTASGSQKSPPALSRLKHETGDFLAVIGNAASGPLLDRFRNWFSKNSTLPLIAIAPPGELPEAGWSDHWSFWRHGYPAVMVTDTAIFRNPNYHQPGDTAETLDYDRLTLAVKGLEGVISELIDL
jgi:Zn-dependent M28 family amino/carboxypeptidase